MLDENKEYTGEKQKQKQINNTTILVSPQNFDIFKGGRK